jgi:hypothetical protein
MAFNIRSSAGWLRLWVLSAILSGALVAAYAIDSYPQRETIQFMHEIRLEQLTPEYLAWEREFRGEDSSALPTESLPPIAEALKLRRDALQAELETSLAALPGEQREHVVHMGSLWLGGNLVLLLLGWLIGWVVRGFTSK